MMHITPGELRKELKSCLHFPGFSWGVARIRGFTNTIISGHYFRKLPHDPPKNHLAMDSTISRPYQALLKKK